MPHTNHLVFYMNLTQVLQRRADGRLQGNRARNNHPMYKPQLSVCLRFLWLKYQFDAEGMPDKWQFEGGRALTIGDKVIQLPIHSSTNADNYCNSTATEAMELDTEETLEDEVRAISKAALFAIMSTEPTAAAVLGPNTCSAPRRYIGVMKPVDLYQFFRTWFMETQDRTSSRQGPPAFNTFLRALELAKPWIRFRKQAGQHPQCDICLHFKTQLRTGPHSVGQRAQLIEEYNQHLLKQWLDREVDANFTSMALQCAKSLQSQPLSRLSGKLSVLTIRADGVDQAKFRCPRVLAKGHLFDRLVRPALHVQGIWCHGFGFHLAVADADFRKDTNNNVEAIARMLEQVHHTAGALPETICLIQDNTARECKNQKIIKFFTKSHICKPDLQNKLLMTAATAASG